MAEPTTDILMKFHVQGSSDPVPAESTLTISLNDKLALNKLPGFSSRKFVAPPFTQNSFCLIDQFNFGASLVDKESGAHKAKEQAAAQEALLKKQGVTPKPTTTTQSMFDPAEAEFARWRSAKDWKTTPTTPPPFVTKTGEFSFNRRIDIASPILFQSCCNHQQLSYVTILKRVAAASLGIVTTTGDYGDDEAMGYLRIDFSNVMITGIDWNDGDILEEKCKFQARTMVISYLSKQNDGSLSEVPAITWEKKIGDTDVAPNR